MGDSDSIINLGELSKPATVLVEKIADAIGGIAKPWQIKRVAHAEAEGDKIRAVAEIEITALTRRAARRFLMEEAKKQQNMESIISKALPEVGEQAKAEEVEEDWIASFFDKCRLISDEQMQRLWAKILAGEANSPGRFSKRTVAMLASLDKSDAAMFSKLCRFKCLVTQLVPIIFDYTHPIYSECGINFELLCDLESIGLIHLDTTRTHVVDDLAQKIAVDYFGQKISVEFAKAENNELAVGSVLFTQAGSQLATICEAQPRDGFIEFLKEAWRNCGTPTSVHFGPPQF
jgi:hypothetical protein